MANLTVVPYMTTNYEFPPAAPIGSGQYFFTSSPDANSASAALGNGTFRARRFFLPWGILVDRIGGEITVIGDVGSTLRIGIYGDTAAALDPTKLVLDVGTIDGHSATVQEVTLGSSLA